MTPLLCILLLSVLTVPPTISAHPATFIQDFRITWSDSQIEQLQGGSGVQLVIDQNSGCGFVSKNQYLFGHVSIGIKRIPGDDSAGTATVFYMNSDIDTRRDEIDSELLGNLSGQPYTVRTNVFTHRMGDHDQRVNHWFDPAADFHTSFFGIIIILYVIEEKCVVNIASYDEEAAAPPWTEYFF